MFLPDYLRPDPNFNMIMSYDVIIVGGSYAGLSAAMALGRSLRNVLVIDSGMPCNRQTPHSHNFITHDGETPKQIRETAKQQVLQYKTVRFHNGLATRATHINNAFTIETETGESFTSRKVIFATGITDVMPAIKDFAACWGISVLHCPYCHGYEVRGQPLGVLANGDIAFEFTKFIHHWSRSLVLFTHGKSKLTAEQTAALSKRNITVVEKEITGIDHTNGYISNLLFQDGTTHPLTALFARVEFKQHSSLPQELGCVLTEQGFLQIDDFQRTTVPGVYAAGDNTTMFRSVSAAIAAGTKAGAMVNKEMIDQDF
jgi:thioredoxin reductase